MAGVIRGWLSRSFYMKNELCVSRVSFKDFSLLLLRVKSGGCEVRNILQHNFTVIIWIFLIKYWNFEFVTYRKIKSLRELVA